MVMVDGTIVPIVSLLSNGVRIAPPAYGAKVVITIFSTNQFSLVTETDITVVNPLVLTYSLSQAPASTQPSYVSTLVRSNGRLMGPPLLQYIRANGSSLAYRITFDTGSVLQFSVYADDRMLISGVDYSITGNTIVFASVPELATQISLVGYTADTEYSIIGNQITFLAGYISFGDEIRVTTHSQDIDYEFHTETFAERQSNEYRLADVPDSNSTVTVWLSGKPAVLGVDYVINTAPSLQGWGIAAWDEYPWDLAPDAGVEIKITSPGGWDGVGWDTVGWNEERRVVVNYMTGREGRPATTVRMLSNQAEGLDIVVDPLRTTVLLGNVYAHSTEIEISDCTCITAPTTNQPGLVYINEELIGFTEIHASPSIQHPRRGILTGLQRNRKGTSGDPRSVYNVLFYDGDSSTTDFITEAAAQAIATTVWLGGRLQIENVDYTMVDLPGGQYVRFTSAPPVGYRNVKIVALNVDEIATNLCHTAGSSVTDAGEKVTMLGRYHWEAASRGLQYSTTNQARFILEHSKRG